MKTRQTLRNLAPVLATLFIVGCGKAGSIGKVGELGLQGVSNGRCIPNNEKPFGPIRKLTESERQRAYQFIKSVDDVGSAELGAEFAVVYPEEEHQDPAALVLKDALQSGQCTGKGRRDAIVGDGYVFDFAGESCPVTYKREDSKGQSLANGLMFLKMESTFRLQDPTLLGGEIRARQLKQEWITNKDRDADLRISCGLNKGSIELSDGSSVATFSLLEVVVEGDVGKPGWNIERLERRLLKFSDFSVELVETRHFTNDSETVTRTINGEPIIETEAEAAGMKANTLHFDYIGFGVYQK